MKKFIITLAILGVTFASANQGQGQRGGSDREPPKEAIEICEGQEEGSSCTMTTPRGNMEGTCKNTPDDKYFVCMPENMPRR